MGSQSISKWRGHRGRSVLEHVEPPGVVAAHHAHVVGHQVQDHPHALRAQGGGEPLESVLAPELRVDGVVVDDVVAVGASRSRTQDRRQIAVAHPERGEIGHQRQRVVEGEAAMELEPVGRPGHGRPRGRRGLDGIGGALGGELGGAARVRRAAPFLTHRLGQGGHARVVAPELEVEGEPFPPGRKTSPVGGGRGLVGLADDVLQAHRDELGGTAAEELVDGADQIRGHLRDTDRVHGRPRGQQPLALQADQQPGLILGPGDHLVAAAALVRKESEAGEEVQVEAPPVVGQGRQRRGCEGDEALRRQLGRWREVAVRVLFQAQQAVGEDAGAGQGRADPLGQRAQVLADRQTAVAVALERQHPQQVAEGIADPGPVGRRAAGRYPEQGAQCGDPVDAQGPGGLHASAQDGGPGRVARLAQACGDGRRDRPDLTLGVLRIGRRADPRALGVDLGRGPDLGPAGLRPQCELGTDPHPQSELPGAPSRPGELLLGLPLQVLEELDLVPVLGGEGGDLGRGRVAIGGGPVRPARRGRVLAPQMLGQCLEHRVAPEGLSARVLIGAKGVSALGTRIQVLLPETAIDEVQRLALGAGDRAVMDAIRGAQGPQLGLEGGAAHQLQGRRAGGKVGNRLDVQVQGIEEQPTRGCVQVNPFRIVGKEGVQGTDVDDPGTESGPELDEPGEVREVPDSPVAGRAQGREQGAGAPDPAAVLDGLRAVAGGRGHDQTGLGAGPRVAALDPQSVIAGWKLDREREAVARVTAPADPGHAGHRQTRWDQGALVQRPPLLVEHPGHRSLCLRGRPAQTDLDGLPGTHHPHRLEHAPPMLRMDLLE